MIESFAMTAHFCGLGWVIARTRRRSDTYAWAMAPITLLLSIQIVLNGWERTDISGRVWIAALLVVSGAATIGWFRASRGSGSGQEPAAIRQPGG